MKNAGLLTSMMSTLALPNMASAQSLFDSPLEYFGGSDAGVYQSWASKNNQGYTRSAWFPSTSSPSKGVALHWRMEEDRIHMGVAARATGWVGFGFSEAGGMEGSDVVYFERNSPSTAVDAHILEEKIPIVDDCNDYSLVNAVIDDDFIIFETFRALNTTDNQDRSLLPDSHPDSPATLVIAAWGEEENIGYHGPNNRVRGQLRLYENNQDDVGASFEEIMTDQADGSFVLQASDYTISTAETQYIPFCISREDLVAQGVPIDNDSLYLIGFEPIVDPRAVAHVHHFTVFGGSNENLTTCGVEDALDQVYGWAPGEVPLSLPEDVGRPFGDWDSVVSLRMVIHYDNPQGIAGILDSSGVRFHYTTKPRLYELGTATYGDPLLRLEGSPVGSGYSSHVFDCPGSCTERAFNGESINVIRQFIHMHRTGTSAQMHVLRDGDIVHEANVDFFKFDQQGNQAIQQEPFKIYPGDALRVNCQYQSDSSVIFGKGSSDEMCLASFLYYPRKKILGGRFQWICPHGVPLPGCSASHEYYDLESASDLTRAFGESRVDHSCSEPVELDELSPQSGQGQDNAPSSGLMFRWLPARSWVLLGFIVARRVVGSEKLVFPLLIE